MRDRLRRWLETGLGEPGRALLAWRTRGQAERLLRRRGLAAPAARLAARLQDRVVRGPFAGMLYPRRRGDIVHAAKLLGAYECELHGALEALLARHPTLVVNVGAGDGYYAVGLAHRLRAPRVESGLPAAARDGPLVLAVDPDPLARRACRDTARRNGVADLVLPLARIDTAALEGRIRPRTAGGGRRAAGHALVLVDAEGFEDELLDPARAPALAHADLLVETHDFARPGVAARLTARFATTHDVRTIAIASRATADFPELAEAPAALALGLLDEFRHVPQAWLVATARVP